MSSNAIDGVDVPPDLLDPDAAVWHDQAAYHRYMAEGHWSMPSAERMGVPTHSVNRRAAAVRAWCKDSGLLDARHADSRAHQHRRINALFSIGLS